MCPKSSGETNTSSQTGLIVVFSWGPTFFLFGEIPGLKTDPSPQRALRFQEGETKETPALWMDEIRWHHFKTMVGTIVCWYLRGNHPSMVSQVM